VSAGKYEGRKLYCIAAEELHDSSEEMTDSVEEDQNTDQGVWGCNTPRLDSKRRNQEYVSNNLYEHACKKYSMSFGDVNTYPSRTKGFQVELGWQAGDEPQEEKAVFSHRDGMLPFEVS
jgi:hypothetical protein